MTLPAQDKKVSLYRCESYNYAEVKQIIARAGDDLLGGWKAFIPGGAKVLLKPNFLKAATPEQVVCTHPSVVKAVAELCREAGAGKIIIGDSPGFGSAPKVAEKSGVLKIAGELGIEVVEFTESVTVAAPAHFLHRHFTIAREVAEADVVINLPKFKTHAMMVLTLAVKNLYGAFVGKQKARWHFQCGRDYNNFARLLVELAYTVRPAVSILDAVVGMEGNGPGSGTPRKLGFLAASRDMISLDRVVTEIAGIAPELMHTLAMADKMGFDTALEHIPVMGDSISSLRIKDLKPAAHMHVEGPPALRIVSGLLRRYMTTMPLVDKKACKGCGICMKACPAEAIDLEAPGSPVKIKHAACIRCFCCQELCPEGAIAAKDAMGVRLLKALGLE